jgi:serine phosphatase RsbU (regulator of sigma subunit)
MTAGRYGSLLGVFDHVLYEVERPMAPGELLVFYTDGLTDAPGDQAVPMGEIVEFLCTADTGSVETIADNLRGLKRRRRPHRSADDTALLVLRFDGPAVAEDVRRTAVGRTSG